MLHDSNATWGHQSAPPAAKRPGSNPVFTISLKRHLADYDSPDIHSEAAYLQTGSLELTNGTTGNFMATECYWVPALIEYDISFDQASHAQILPSGATAGRIVALANNTNSNTTKLQQMYPDYLASGIPYTMDFFYTYL